MAKRRPPFKGTAGIGCATLLIMAMTPDIASCQNSLAIKGGRILTMAGEPIESGNVIIRDGKITAVSSDASIPVEAKVIDASGKLVMPGFVEVHSSAAMSQANETNPNVPYVSVLDTIDPMRSYFPEARRNGITTVCVVPGNSTMIGGKSAIIKTGGSFLDDMILKRESGIKISLRPQGDGSRMAHLAALRNELDQATKKLETPDENQRQDDNESALDESMLRLVSGQLTAIIYCDEAMDVPHALKLVEDYKLKPVLVLGKACYKAAKQVSASGFPVVLDSELVFWETDPRTQDEEKIVLTERFRAEDVEFTFQAAQANNSTLGNNYLWYQAAIAVQYGMPREQALHALTMLPATQLGIEQMVGSLEPGKDADIAILTGDPLDIGTWVDTTIVNGQVVYERKNDEPLRQLLGSSAENEN